jgi:hypothetical protein
LQLFGPFLEEPSNVHGNCSSQNWDAPVGLISRNALTLIDIFFCLVYIFDALLIIFANPARFNGKYGPFSAMPSCFIRLLVCFFIYLDCFLWFADVKTGRLSRALLPLLFICRRTSFRNISVGLGEAMRKSWTLVKVLWILIFIWALIGHFLFRDLENDALDDNTGRLGRFSTYEGSLFTVL